MKGKLLLALEVAAVVVVVLLLFYLSGGPRLGREASFLFVLQAKGGGRLLVNGTSMCTANFSHPFVETIVSFSRPFTALIEAAPDPCYELVQLLVNETPVEGSRVELTVEGDTTVRAVFERPFHSIYIRSNAKAFVVENGISIYSLPAVLELARCEVLNLTPLAPETYEPLNGSIVLKVERDVELFFAFRKVAALVRLYIGLVPVRVNGTLYESTALLKVPLNVTLLVEPAADERGCIEYNETHLVCVVEWWVRLHGWTLNGLSEFLHFNPVIAIPVKGDLELHQLSGIFSKP